MYVLFVVISLYGIYMINHKVKLIGEVKKIPMILGIVVSFCLPFIVAAVLFTVYLYLLIRDNGFIPEGIEDFVNKFKNFKDFYYGEK